MWEGKEGGAQGKTAFLPPFDRNRGGGGAEAVCRRRAAALPGTAAAGK
jgi:hypothetical protein